MQPVGNDQMFSARDYPSNGGSMMMQGQQAALSNDYPSGDNSQLIILWWSIR
jgi:hypothetical protein